jgi:hypothetical protein
VPRPLISADPRHRRGLQSCTPELVIEPGPATQVQGIIGEIVAAGAARGQDTGPAAPSAGLRPAGIVRSVARLRDGGCLARLPLPLDSGCKKKGRGS